MKSQCRGNQSSLGIIVNGWPILGSRLLNWRKNFCSANIWLARDGENCRLSWSWLKDKSRYGTKTGEWKRKKKTERNSFDSIKIEICQQLRLLGWWSHKKPARGKIVWLVYTTHYYYSHIFSIFFLKLYFYCIFI